MISMPSIRWAIFGATFGITVFALFIQINSTENVNRHFNSFQNEQNTTSSHSDPDFAISHSKHFSPDVIELHIIQTIIDKFAAVLSSSHNKYLHRYKRDSILAPLPSSNSSRLTMIENQLFKMQQQLAYLNSSASLSIEDKSRISVMETTIKEIQTNLDSYQKENSGMMQVILDKFETSILIGIVQSIKSRQFTFAEEQLPLTDDSIYEKVVHKVYAHEVDNIDLLLRFGGSIMDLEKKFKLYEALYYEIVNNGTVDIEILCRLGQSLRKGILEVATGTIADKSQSLIRILWEDNRNASIKLIIAAFLNNQSWPLVKQIKDEIHRSRGLKFLGDVYKEIIEKIMNTSSVENILNKVYQNLNVIEEKIMIHEGIVNELERKEKLYNYDILYLVRQMKIIWDDPEFNNEDWRYRYKIIINKLPRSLRSIVLLSSVCIKNFNYNEYMYPADSRDLYDGYRHIFTGIPKDKHLSPEFKWKINFNRDFWITLRNVRYDDFASPGAYTVLNTPVYEWYVTVDEEGIRMSSYDNSYLYVDGNKKTDNMRYVYGNGIEGKQFNKWELVDCPDIS